MARPGPASGVAPVPASGEPSLHIKGVLLAMSSMTVMAGAIISPSLPAMARHFSSQPDVLIKLILTMPALSIAIFGMVMGYLSDLISRSRLLSGALLLYAIAGFGGFFLESLPMLLVSRAALGLAVAAIISISTAMIGDYFDDAERLRFMGLQASFMALGGVVFMGLGGILADISWRGPFFIYLSSLALFPIALQVLRSNAGARVAAPPAAVDDTKLGLRTTLLVYFLAMSGMGLFYMIPSQLPFLLSRYGVTSGFAISMMVSAATAASAVASFYYGRCKRYFSFAGLYAFGFYLVAAGFSMVGLGQHYPVIIFGIAIAGAGFGLSGPNAGGWLLAITPERLRGRVIGGLVSAFFLGQFISPLIIAPLTIHFSLASAYMAAAIFTACVATLLAFLAVNQADPQLRQDGALARR